MHFFKNLLIFLLRDWLYETKKKGAITGFLTFFSFFLSLEKFPLPLFILEIASHTAHAASSPPQLCITDGSFVCHFQFDLIKLNTITSPDVPLWELFRVVLYKFITVNPPWESSHACQLMINDNKRECWMRRINLNLGAEVKYLLSPRGCCVGGITKRKETRVSACLVMDFFFSEELLFSLT